MGIGTLIPTLNLPLAFVGGAVFLGGLAMRQVFFSMIGCSIVLIGLAGGYYMPGIIGGIGVQIVGAAAELIFGRRGRWASTLLGNLGCLVVAGSTLGSQFVWTIH
jgi:ABC-type spermidine/putrescine transport system permease subunit I